MTYPIIIDNVKFAIGRQFLEGKINVSESTRLVEWINTISNETVTEPGYIEYQLVGKVNGIGQHCLSLKLKANLRNQCQRCMNLITLHFDLNFDYQLTPHLHDFADTSELEESDNYDWIKEDKAMDLTSLIEDELMMAMPIAPMHDFQCQDSTTQSGEKPNPFAVLKEVLKR